MKEINSKYFTYDELKCKETGDYDIHPEFLEVLNKLRERCGFPFVITSGYRSPEHSIEAKKASEGTHALGVAVDIKANSSQRFKIMQEATTLGVTRFGINKSFIHIDIGDWFKPERFPRQVVWAY
jgi:zinc D-Ala-D-Ala carboxypeptidase